MKPPPFELHIPRSLAGALDMLAGLDNCRVLAGGQSLLPMLAMRLASPDHLVDLNRVAELRYIREEQGDIAIGAMTRQRDLEYSALIAERVPLLKEAIRNVGHRQTRNRGTLGGSLCHLDPSAELPAVMATMDATLVAQSPRGVRRLTMSVFAEGLMTTALAPDEILTEVRIRPWKPGHGACFVEFARRHGDFAVVSAAALIELDTAGRVARAALTLGGVVATPLRMMSAERALVGRAGGFESAVTATEAFDALDDPAFPAWYRKRLAARLLQRAVDTACRRARPEEMHR